MLQLDFEPCHKSGLPWYIITIEAHSAMCPIKYKNPSELASQLNTHMPPKPKNQRKLNNWFYLCIDDGKSSAGLPSSKNREELVRETEKHVVHISNKNTKIRDYFMDESLFRNNSPGANDEIVVLAKGWRGDEWNYSKCDEMIDTCVDHAKKSEIIGLNQTVGRLFGCTVLVRRGYRAYGYYRCNRCNQTWTSAYSFKNFKQSCKSCEIMMFAHKRCVRSGEAVKTEGQGRHLQENCERCIKGLKCTALISERNSYHPKPQYVQPKPKYAQPKPQYVQPKPQYVKPKPQYNPPKPQYVNTSNPVKPKSVSKTAVQAPTRKTASYSSTHQYLIRQPINTVIRSPTPVAKKPKNNGFCSIQ